MPKRYVFICSPYAGDVAKNVELAKRYLRFAIEMDQVPFAPHLLFPQVLDDNSFFQRERGLALGECWLTRCDEVWAFGDTISPGMRSEIDLAGRCGIPVRYFTEECDERDGAEPA